MEERESFIVKKKVSGMPCLEAAGMVIGRLTRSRAAYVIGDVWLSPVSPKLEARAKIREALSYSSSPGH